MWEGGRGGRVAVARTLPPGLRVCGAIIEDSGAFRRYLVERHAGLAWFSCFIPWSCWYLAGCNHERCARLYRIARTYCLQYYVWMEVVGDSSICFFGYPLCMRRVIVRTGGGL